MSKPQPRYTNSAARLRGALAELKAQRPELAALLSPMAAMVAAMAGEFEAGRLSEKEALRLESLLADLVLRAERLVVRHENH